MRRPGPLPATGQPGREQLRDLTLLSGVVAIAALGIYAMRPRRLSWWRR